MDKYIVCFKSDGCHSKSMYGLPKVAKLTPTRATSNIIAKRRAACVCMAPRWQRHTVPYEHCQRVAHSRVLAVATVTSVAVVLTGASGSAPSWRWRHDEAVFSNEKFIRIKVTRQLHGIGPLGPRL